MKAIRKGVSWVLFRNDMTQNVREVPVYDLSTDKFVRGVCVRVRHGSNGQLVEFKVSRQTARMLARRINELLEETK